MSCISKKQLALFRQYLSVLGIRDTDFDDAKILRGDEYVAIIQDGVNKKVKISDLFLNFSDETVIEHMLQGDPGDSAYEIWLQQPGNAGKSVAEFLASLKGKDGKDGKDGADGAVGPIGPAGIVNATAYVGENDGGDPEVSVNKVGNELNFIFKNLGNGGGSHDGGDDSEYELPVASEDVLGGIKLGFDGGESKNYPVQLDQNNRAFVNVPWTGGGGDGTGTGYYEQIFCVTTKPASGEPTPPSLPGRVAIDDTGSWKHYAENAYGSGNIVWMAQRWVYDDGRANPYEAWQGPWNISGDDGDPGTDGTTMEYIYTRTVDDESSSKPATPSYSDTQASASITAQTEAHGSTSTQFEDWYPSGWTDNPQGVDSEYRFEWMSLRVRTGGHNNIGGEWSEFTPTILWSSYGVQGLDGDGVEYIFYAGTEYPTVHPDDWDDTTDEFQEREYIPSVYANIWFDNPIDLSDLEHYGPGYKQWVSVRKKYIDDGDTEPKWHAYSQPAFWSSYPMDGTGIFADMDNEMMAASIDENGDCEDFEQVANAAMYNGSEVLTHTIKLVSVTDSEKKTYTQQEIDAFNDGDGLVTIGGSALTIGTAVSSGPITVALKAGDINLETKNLFIKFILTYTDNTDQLNPVYVERPVVLTVVGVSFGGNGSSYRLATDVKTIRRSNNANQPTSVNPTLVAVSGEGGISVYTPTQMTSLDISGKHFKVMYQTKKKGSNATTAADMSADSVSTSTITDYIRFFLYYGVQNNYLLVDQETVYVITDGEDVDPESIKFKSVVFKRAAQKPVGVVNQTGVRKMITSSTYDTTYGGIFTDPVPYGWSDAIPEIDSNLTDEENRLWMSTRIFTSDHTASHQNPNIATWSVPVQAVPTNEYKVYFAYAKSDGTAPALPDENKSSSGFNTYDSTYPYGYNGQVWFDPERNAKVSASESRDWENMAWRAESYYRNGDWTDWIIMPITGENGADGTKIVDIDVKWAIGTSDTIPGSSATWYDIDSPSFNPLPGSWVWSRQIYEYDDGTYSDPIYSKMRYATDGVSGKAPVAVYRGPFQYNTSYYGSEDRVDIVYNQSNNTYYIASPNPPHSPFNSNENDPVPPSGNNIGTYWLTFGANYDNIATGTLFAEGANVANFNFIQGVMKSVTSGTGGHQALELDGNSGTIYAENATIKGHIDAGEGTIGSLDIETNGLSGTHTEWLDNNHTIKHESTLEIGSDEFSYHEYYGYVQPSNNYTEGSITAGLDSPSRDGFVEIRTDGIDTAGCKSALFIDSGGVHSAFDINGNGLVNGIIAGNRLNCITLSGNTSFQLTLSSAPSGSTVLYKGISGSSSSIYLPSVASSDTGVYYDILTVTASITLYPALSSSIKIRTIGDGNSGSNLDHTVLTTSTKYRVMFDGTEWIVIK